MMKIILSALILVIAFSSCTPRQLQCFLENMEINRVYEVNVGKDKLKDIIFDSYTYDVSLLRLNFGAVMITEKSVDEKYRASTENYMFKNDFEKISSQIRMEMPDTLSLRIGKFHSQKGYELLLVLDGTNDRSTVTVAQMNYAEVKECPPLKRIVKNGLEKFSRIIDL